MGNLLSTYLADKVPCLWGPADRGGGGGEGGGRIHTYCGVVYRVSAVAAPAAAAAHVLLIPLPPSLPPSLVPARLHSSSLQACSSLAPFSFLFPFRSFKEPLLKKPSSKSKVRTAIRTRIVIILIHGAAPLSVEPTTEITTAGNGEVSPSVS